MINVGSEDNGKNQQGEVSRKDRAEALRHYCQRELWSIGSQTRTALQESAGRDPRASQQRLLVAMQTRRMETTQQIHRAMHLQDQEIVIGLYQMNKPNESVTQEQILNTYLANFDTDFSRQPNPHELRVLTEMAQNAHTYLLRLRDAVDVLLDAHHTDATAHNTESIDALLTSVRTAMKPA